MRSSIAETTKSDYAWQQDTETVQECPLLKLYFIHPLDELRKGGACRKSAMTKPTSLKKMENKARLQRAPFPPKHKRHRLT